MSAREITVRAKAWTGHGVETVRVLVDDDGTVRAWDDIACHYTRLHALSASAQRRIRHAAEVAS